MTTILRTENLRKSFEGIVAVDDLDFEMEDGTVECVIGPNGAGKTTLFNLLTGILKPDRGTIEFDGEDITGESLHRVAKRGIVRKYQTPTVYENLTVERNLHIAATASTRENADSRIEDALDRIELGDQRDALVNTLDHGSKQWLEIAMVLVNEPRLMLLDEPTAGMTHEETRRTAELIKSINETGLPVIVIEHDLDFIRQLSARITVLHRGQVLAQGDIDTIEANDEVQKVYIGGEA
jgi:urea ABC transporter ATP-binding protein UrtD